MYLFQDIDLENISFNSRIYSRSGFDPNQNTSEFTSDVIGEDQHETSWFRALNCSWIWHHIPAAFLAPPGEFPDNL